MTETWSGILLLLAFLAFSGLIIFFIWQDKVKNALWFILFLALGLRLITSNDNFLHSWDERYHALVAKNLIQHPLKPTLHEHPVLDYSNENWVGANIWLAKPSFPLWIMSGSIAVFGNNLFAVRLPSVLLGLLAVWLTFLIGKQVFNRRIGLWAAYLHAINGLIIELVGGRISSDHVELCFIVMVELGIYFSLFTLTKQKASKYAILTGVFMGLAFLSKWYPGLIVLPVWAGFFIYSEQYSFKSFLKTGGVIVLSAAIISLPWTFFMLNAYPNEMKAILSNAVMAYSETVESHGAPFYYFLHKIMVIYGELIYIPLIGIIVLLIRNFKVNAKQFFGILLWILLPLIIFSLADTKRFTYILISAPAFFLMVGWGIEELRNKLEIQRLKWLALVGIVLLVGLPMRYSIERAKFFSSQTTDSSFYNSQKINSYHFLNENTIVFGTDDYIEMMFHTTVYAAYREIPSLAIQKELVAQGFILYEWTDKGLVKLKSSD